MRHLGVLCCGLMLVIGSATLAISPGSAGTGGPRIYAGLVVPDKPFPLLPAAMPRARGLLILDKGPSVDRLTLRVEGLPPNSRHTVFTCEKPIAPFGVCSYLGDIIVDGRGRGTQEFVVAASAAFALDVTGAPNLRLPPTRMTHVVLWFGSPQDQAFAFQGRALPPGIPPSGPVTPFDRDREAGAVSLTTGLDPDTPGPLAR